MKILLQYLKPYKGLTLLALLLAAINQVFSMLGIVLWQSAHTAHSSESRCY